MLATADEQVPSEVACTLSQGRMILKNKPKIIRKEGD
jgi:hypothetical protein